MATIEKRKRLDGSWGYRAKIRARGLRAPITQTFPNITEAKLWAKTTEAELRAGRFLKTIESRRHTLAEAIERYKRDVLSRKSASMQESQGYQLGVWKKEIGNLTLDQLTPQIITECRDKFLRTVTHSGRPRTPATVNRMLSALSHLITIATNEWEWMEESPLRKVKKLRESKGRVRSLSEKEREAILTACDNSDCKALGLIVRIALATGMRRSEIANLRWPDIDLSTGRTVIHQTKNGQRRATFISGKTLELVKQHTKVRNLKTDLLFPSPNKTDSPLSFVTAWNTVVTNAGLKDFKFHDLRHEFATRLAEEGASLAQLGEALGHKTLAMVKRYSHLTESSIQEVVERMNNKARL